VGREEIRITWKARWGLWAVGRMCDTLTQVPRWGAKRKDALIKEVRKEERQLLNSTFFRGEISPLSPPSSFCACYRSLAKLRSVHF
jgi:hypothetical protein